MWWKELPKLRSLQVPDMSSTEGKFRRQRDLMGLSPDLKQPLRPLCELQMLTLIYWWHRLSYWLQCWMELVLLSCRKVFSLCWWLSENIEANRLIIWRNLTHSAEKREKAWTTRLSHDWMSFSDINCVIFSSHGSSSWIISQLLSLSVSWRWAKEKSRPGMSIGSKV